MSALRISDWAPRARAVPRDVPRSWYVGLVRPGQGRKAIYELHGRDYDAYQPTETVWFRPSPNRKIKQWRPLFGSYLFIGLAEEQGFGDIHAVEAVHRLLVTGSSEPAEIPYEPIDALRQAEIRGEFDKTRRGFVEYRPGQKVRVTQEGGFEGLVGEIKRAKGDQRWQLFLDCLNIPLTMREADIEPLI